MNERIRKIDTFKQMIVEMNEKKVILQNLQMEISNHSNDSYVKRKNPSLKKALIHHDLMLIYFLTYFS